MVTEKTAKEGHCAVPAKRLPDLLTRPVHYTVSEVEDEPDNWRVKRTVAEREFEDLEPEAADEEILGTDDRTVVTNTLAVPNRWICAIDILTANPKWPRSASNS